MKSGGGDLNNCSFSLSLSAQLLPCSQKILSHKNTNSGTSLIMNIASGYVHIANVTLSTNLIFCKRKSDTVKLQVGSTETKMGLCLPLPRDLH